MQINIVFILVTVSEYIVLFSASSNVSSKPFIIFSLGYITEHMNPNNKLAPLFEAQLELLDPDMVFAPSLDPNDEKGFMALIKSIIDDIINMSALIERIDPKRKESYEQQILNNDDINDMKEEILNGIEKVIVENKILNQLLQGFH